MKKLLLLFSIALLFNHLHAQEAVIFEEQFDGGIPGTWEIGPGEPEGAVWQWTHDGRANDGLVNGQVVNALFWGTRGPIQSPSVSNGCAMYNSDIYDGGGTGVGQGMFPGTHSGTLVSPSIDCTDYPFVSLKMNQYARANANQISTIFEVSNDGGMTWTPFVINEAVVGNGSTTADNVLLVDISEVAGNQPDVKLRFTWSGRYYFWLIDDVQLIETPRNNLSLGDFFYAPASYAQPASQIITDTMGFSADVSNIGREAQTNVVLKATIRNAQSDILYQDSVVIEELPAFYVDSTLQIENLFVPDMLSAGQTYTLSYEVYSLDDLDDFNPLDNSDSEPFIVTENLFAKEDGLGIGGIRPGGGGDYQLGNLYQMSPLSGNNFIATNVTFTGAKNAADGPMDGEQVTVLLYKVKDNVLPDFSNFNDASVGQDDDLDLVGFQGYTFPDGFTNYTEVGAELLNVDAEPGVPLVPGGRYFLVISYEGTAGNIFAGVDDDINYFQISTIVYTSNWFLGGFGPEEAALVRMEIELSTSTDEQPLPDNVLSVYPNPTPDQLNVGLDFANPSDAMVIIADINGRVLMVREYYGVQKENLNYDVSRYAPGTYLIRVSTAEGTKTKKFVVAK
jgi:hypothetical protein